MDYSKFMDESFNAKDWINTAFRSNTDTGGSNDQFATTLVMKLQLLVQEVNNVIEETSQEVVTNLPRVLRDIEVVKQEAVLLHEQMITVKDEIHKVEQDTSQSMQNLLKLDTMKCRMDATSDALKEADNWTVLSSEIEEVIQSGDKDLLASKLVAMQQSLRLLVNVPDYEDRYQHLEALKNRLESLISPEIVTALSSHDQQLTKRYVKIFSSIERLPQMYKYYDHYNKSELVKTWSNLHDDQEDFITCISRFYDIVLSTFHTQVAWCAPVFEDPLHVVCNMLTATFQSLQTKISSAISTFLDDEDSSTTTCLCRLLKETLRFTRTLERALLDKQPVLDQDYLSELAAAIYLPFETYLEGYKKIETNFMMQQLELITMEDAQYVDIGLDRLGDSVSLVSKLLIQADHRCVELTGGYMYTEAQAIYKQILANYATQVRRIMTNIGERFRKNTGHVDMDSWAMFSYCLRIISTVGNIIIEVEELDQTVVSNILSAQDQLTQYVIPPEWRSVVSPLSSMVHIYHITDARKKAFETLCQIVADKQTALITSLKDIRSLSEQAHKLAFEVVFAEINKQLQRLSDSPVWVSEQAGGALTSELPEFSLSPQEYITQIGQYIMTVPQYLEPYSSLDSQQSNTAVQKLALVVASKYGKLPYTKKLGDDDDQYDILWLESIARATMYSYSDEILRIHEITSHATRQLITDIEYLLNVLEDLELEPIDQLRSILLLLKAKPDEYHGVSQSVSSGSLVSGIRAMRDID